jgi:hypothetical protein
MCHVASLSNLQSSALTIEFIHVLTAYAYPTWLLILKILSMCVTSPSIPRCYDYRVHIRVDRPMRIPSPTYQVQTRVDGVPHTRIFHEITVDVPAELTNLEAAAIS